MRIQVTHAIAGSALGLVYAAGLTSVEQEYIPFLGLQLCPAATCTISVAVLVVPNLQHQSSSTR